MVDGKGAGLVDRFVEIGLQRSGELLVMPRDGGDCEDVIAEFAKAGVDVDALAAQLQAEGAKAFSDSWNELMKVIESKSMVLTQGA